MYTSLSLDILPEYLFSSFRYFDKHEKFVTRYCGEDILILMISGVLRFHEDGVPTELHPGEYYIQRRGLFQQGVEESDEPEYYYIHFLGSFSSTGKTLPLRGSAEIGRLIPLCRELDLLAATNTAKIASASVFFQILSHLSNAQLSSGSSLVRQVLSYVIRENRADVTLDEISSAVGYCKTHIINTFKQETGKTPYACIVEQRLNASKQLLFHSDLSLEQIGVRCGFGNYINFYKNFVRYEKISPSEWRLKHRISPR